MKFSEVIQVLQHGGSAWRQSWEGDKEIVKQIPQCVSKEVVPKMTSLPSIIKPKINTVGNGEISYHDQVIIITFVDDEKTPASATYYVPTWEDIFAEDWTVEELVDGYKERMKSEFYELVDRMQKLDKFFNTGLFKKLPLEKQLAMKNQMEAMISYRDALGERCELEGIKL